MADQKSIDVLFEQFAKMKVVIQALQQDNKALNDKVEDLKKVVDHLKRTCVTSEQEKYRQLNL